MRPTRGKPPEPPKTLPQARDLLKRNDILSAAATDPSIRDKVRHAADLAAQHIADVIETGDAREALEASNIALRAWASTTKIGASLDPDETAEERERKLDEMLDTPEVQAWLTKKMAGRRT